MNFQSGLIKVIPIISILLLVSVVYAEDLNVNGTVIFNVSSPSLNLFKFIDTIKTSPDYKGYDVETVKWMEGLENKTLFMGNNSFIVMNNSEALKIPPEPDVTDTDIYDIFKAKIVEKHDLGDNLSQVYEVCDVKFINQEIVGNGLA